MAFMVVWLHDVPNVWLVLPTTDVNNRVDCLLFTDIMTETKGLLDACQIFRRNIPNDKEKKNKPIKGCGQ